MLHHQLWILDPKTYWKRFLIRYGHFNFWIDEGIHVHQGSGLLIDFDLRFLLLHFLRLILFSITMSHRTIFDFKFVSRFIFGFFFYI
mgnify:CR=1 FL=1